MFREFLLLVEHCYQFSSGIDRRIRCLNVVDDCATESILIEVDTSISERAWHVLDGTAEHRPLLKMIRGNHRPRVLLRRVVGLLGAGQKYW